ncbi:hypothetical protein K5D34_04395 [Pseudomonas cichorii]|nr:hypothetical protein [Pseudomonas cichorii]MBX8508933.1 hypothetical protein [Pseudomonas cichorii]MBX8524496.1 hypothetical protein [Pseudomonas cichorii]
MTDYSMVILKRAQQALDLAEPLATLEELVDQLFFDAGDRAQTEEIQQSRFCESVRSHLGEEESSESVRLAYVYARVTYGYLSQAELDQVTADDWEAGICSHGLTYWTCPCGCFEY